MNRWQGMLPWALLSTFCATAVASASPHSIELRSVVQRRSTGVFDANKAALDGVRAGLKYGAPSTATKKRRATGHSGDVDLSADVVAGLTQTYYGTVKVGTPPQEFQVVFDTGSADFFLADKDAPTISKRFFSNESSTFKDTNTPWATSYADGSGGDGEIVLDTVSCGGFSIPQHHFALAKSSLFDMLTGNFDGIVGLAFTALSSTKMTTFFDALVGTTGLLAEPVFSLYIERADEAVVDESDKKYSSLAAAQRTTAVEVLPRSIMPVKRQPEDASGDEADKSNAEETNSITVQDKAAGVLLLGGIDNTKYKGAINYAPLTQKAYWQVEIDGVSVKGMAATTKLEAVFDSGTSLAYVPSIYLQTIANALGATLISIPDSSGVSVYLSMDCQSIADAQLGLQINGQSYHFAPKDLNLGPLEEGSSTCILSFGAMDITDLSGNPIALIGAAFLRSVYTVHNVGNASIGFAELASSTSSKLVLYSSSSASASSTASDALQRITLPAKESSTESGSAAAATSHLSAGNHCGVGTFHLGCCILLLVVVWAGL